MKFILCGRKGCCPTVDIQDEYVILEDDGKFEGEIFHLTREQAGILTKKLNEEGF